MANQPAPSDSENQSLRKINALTADLTADVADGITVNGLTDINAKLPALNSGRIPVDIGSIGTVTVSNEVEVKNDLNSPVPVSDAGGSITVDGPLTDTQLRATAVSVSGPLTDTQLRASAVPVSGTFFQATQPVSGTVTANAGTGAFEVRPRNGSVTVVAGTTDSTPSTSAEALATNSSRQYLYIQNNSDTDMYFNFGAAATTSHLLVKAGVSVAFDSGFVPTNAVNVICGSASKSFYILHA